MENEVTYLYLDDIIPNRFQPRENFNEQALKEYFDSFGMKYESSIDFDDFCRMIKKNKKYAPKKKKKRKSKYEFKGPVIDEAEKEEEQESHDEINKNEFDGDNEEEIEIEEEKNEIKDDNIEESGKLNNGNSEHETSASNGIKV